MASRLKDIANDLGLSIATISKVLRDHPDIPAETRRRVLKRMRELNYQPNFAARSLVTGRTWTLGLVVPDFCVNGHSSGRISHHDNARVV